MRTLHPFGKFNDGITQKCFGIEEVRCLLTKFSWKCEDGFSMYYHGTKHRLVRAAVINTSNNN